LTVLNHKLSGLRGPKVFEVVTGVHVVANEGVLNFKFVVFTELDLIRLCGRVGLSYVEERVLVVAKVVVVLCDPPLVNTFHCVGNFHDVVEIVWSE